MEAPKVWKEAAEIVKSTVLMEDVVASFLPGTRILHHRIKCPFHGGSHYNCSLYEHSFYCFVCHEGGSVADFVMKLYGCSFPEAVIKINDHLGLGLALDDNLTLRQRIEMDEKAAALRAERETRESLKAEKEKAYWDYWDRYIAADRILLNEESDPWDRARAQADMNWLEYIRDTIPVS